MKQFFLNLLKTLFQKESFDVKESISNKPKRTYLDYDWSSVIEFETGGKNYYEKFLKHLTWPKGESGITMGIGADLGYMSKEEFEKYFSLYFTSDENILIKSVIGLKGENARKVLPKVKHIELSWANASEAFVKWTLPKFWEMSNNLWPGLDQLKESAQIALVSLVFNRGASIKGSSRIEMKNIKSLVTTKDYKGIAKEIRNMKRLWLNKNLDGLLKRRDSEAKMIENCV
jgi:GH24 family phage-related lysozyme (muramidase)